MPLWASKAALDALVTAEACAVAYRSAHRRVSPMSAMQEAAGERQREHRYPGGDAGGVYGSSARKRVNLAIMTMADIQNQGAQLGDTLYLYSAVLRESKEVIIDALILAFLETPNFQPNCGPLLDFLKESRTRLPYTTLSYVSTLELRRQ